MRSPRRALLAVPVGSAAIMLTLANAPIASATNGSAFTFSRLGVVVVNGTVDADVNFTVYRILDPQCTGTAFPGPANSCVPQEATDTVVIPAGAHSGKRFRLDQIPTCGPTQQDVYEGAYQPTVTVTGTHNYLAGGIMQLGTCTAATPTPSPATSSPRSTPSTTGGTTRGATTPAASSPAASSSILASGGTATDQTYTDYSSAPVSYQPQLASTGGDHTSAMLLIGVGAISLGGVALGASRKVGHSH